MQKKLIALAVAGLASTAAFAQTNVQIYGLIDYGYAYRFDGLTNATTANSNSAFNGGQASGNRLGFKGTEDLGNGLKAVFLLEQGFALDTNSANNDAQTQNRSINFTRQAYAGLTGNFGTLIGGRLYTPHYTFWQSVLDPFAAGTVGRFQNVMGGTFGGDVTRVDNAVAYVSPNFGGFTLTGAYSNKLSGNEGNAIPTAAAPNGNTTGLQANSNGSNVNVYALYGQYAAGGLTVGLNYHYATTQGKNVGLTHGVAGAYWNDTQNVTLGGAYDFKVAKLSAAVAYNQTDGKGMQVNAPGVTPNNSLEIWNYFVGVTVPVGKVDIKASFLYSDADNWGDAQQYALGANYNLSKRTDIYAAYSYIDADNTRVVASLASSAGVGDASYSGAGFGQGVQVGVRHKF